VIVTLALAIGANTAIFSFVNALLVRPFPFRDAEQLAEISSLRGGQPGKLSMREILDIKEQVPSLASIAAHSGGAGGYNYSGEGRPEEWRACLTTGNLFDVLGVPLAVGGQWPEFSNRDRDFRVILSYGVWKSSFGGRADVVGRKITLDHAPGYEIHGVAPQGFDFPQGIQVYRSIGGFTSYDRRNSRNVVGIARMRDGQTLQQLQAELNGVAQRLAQAHPDTNQGLSFQARSFRTIYSGNVRPYLVVLMGAVGFVLLIACANVANLLLSRALTREREMSVRIALGAGRSQLLAQLLAESMVLSFAAAALGVSLAWWWTRLLRDMIGFDLPSWMIVDLDGRVLLFTTCAAILAGLLSGLAPAVHFWRGTLAESLKEGSRGSSVGKGTGRLRDWMIAGEVALAVVLLAGAGLLIRGFLHLQEQDKGFRSESIQTFRVALGWRRYGTAQIAPYYEQAVNKLAAIPGVEKAGFTTQPPLALQSEFSPATVQASEQPVTDALLNPNVTRQHISENYFELMNIPLKAGRTFSQFDHKDAEMVAIVSERLARHLWPGQNPLGKQLRYDPQATTPGKWLKVVGVAAGVQHREWGGELGYDLYVPYRQQPAANQYMLVKTRLAPNEFARQAEQALWSIDHEQSVFDFRGYDDRILSGIWQLRLSRSLLILFAFVALVLAAIGIYGVMSYLVGQRRREMGIRLALGASPSSVQGLVVRRGAILAGSGLLVGMGGALILGRGLHSLVRGVSVADPLILAAAPAVLAVVVLAACSVPAWRASRIDPAITLRQE